MPRPISITDDQILVAAREVFARDRAAATTREIARVAGVSEGTLFNRFASKEALLQAAVRPPERPEWVRLMESLAGSGDMRANLVSVVRAMVDFVRDRLPLLTLLWSLQVPYPTAEPDADPPPVRDRNRLAAYLRAESQAGRLRACDTEAVAEMLFGSVLSFTLSHRDQQTEIDDSAAASFVAGLIDTLWPAIAPDAD